MHRSLNAPSQSALVALTALLTLAVGCSADTDTDEGDKESAIPAELLDLSWPIVTVDAEVREPLESNDGWIRLLGKCDLQGAVTQLGPDGGLGAARAHAEAASMFRVAAMLDANSLLSAWGEMGEQTDPLGGAHLLAVSHILAGDLDAARLESARLDGIQDPTSEWHAPWATWLADEDPTWPPDLSGLPMELPPTDPGHMADPAEAPHYTLVEQSDDLRTVEAADLGPLVAAALWHEQSARVALDEGAWLDLFGAPYRWPIEGPVVAEAEELPLEMIFGSDLLVPADGPFLAALLGPDGPDAVEAWADKSLLASLAQSSRVDGKIDSELAVDLASELRAAILARSKELTGGNSEGFHRTFADIGRVSVLRSLALVAEEEGSREIGGMLRILAMESSIDEWTADAPPLLSLAAWDAANGNPSRATTLLHDMIRRYPDLGAARFGVDVLSLRVSRRRGGGGPSH